MNQVQELKGALHALDTAENRLDYAGQRLLAMRVRNLRSELEAILKTHRQHEAIREQQ